MKVAFLGRHFPKNSLSIGINISPLLTTKEHGANVEKICISAHGPFTHIDTPYHFCDHGRKITDFDVEDFCGPGVLFDARGWDLKKKLVTLEMFKEAGGANLLSLGSQRVILLVWTGWYEGKVIDSDFTKDHPVIEEKLAQALTGLPIKMVCLDSPSPDPSNGPSTFTRSYSNTEFLSANPLGDSRPSRT